MPKHHEFLHEHCAPEHLVYQNFQIFRIILLFLMILLFMSGSIWAWAPNRTVLYFIVCCCIGRVAEFSFYRFISLLLEIKLEANARFTAPFFTCGILSLFRGWLFCFGFICVGLSFNYVLAVFLSFVYRGVLLEMTFVLIGELSCSVRGCGVLTHFDVGVSRQSLFEPLVAPISR